MNWENNQREQRDEEFNNRQTLDGVIAKGYESGKPPSTVEELTASPEAKAAWDAMLPSDQLALMGTLAKDAKGDIPRTSDRELKWQMLQGLLPERPDEFLKETENPVGLDLPWDMRNKIISQRQQVYGHTYKAPEVAHALGVLQDQIQAAGLDKDSGDKENRALFTGILHDIMQDFQANNNRPMKDEEIRTAGVQILRRIGAGWMSSGTPWFESVGGVPDEAAKIIAADPSWGGVVPSNEQIQRIWIGKQYQQQFGGNTQSPRSAAMSEYSDVIQNYLGASRAQVVSGLEDNPDDAAKTVELSHDTGVPSQIIAPDLEGFQKDYRANLATNLVMNNPALTAYVHSHPMAASVSNDDWGTLDSISNGLHRLRQATDILTAPLQGAISGAARGGAEGLKEGWGEESLAPVTGEQTRQAIPALDPSRGLLPGMENTLATSMLNLGSLALRAMSSAFEAGTGAVGGAVGGLTGSESLGREAKALTEYEMIKPEFAGHPWLAAGHEPPAGVIPELDKSKAERNETLLKGLEDVTREVQQSTTWERSPELFKTFVQQHLADRQISIAGDAVTALYGDKVPVPG